MMGALKKLLAARYRIATQLYAALSFTGLVTVAAILVAWQSFERIDETQKEGERMKASPNWFRPSGLRRPAGSLVAAAPRLTSASTLEDLDAVIAEVSDVRREI